MRHVDRRHRIVSEHGDDGMRRCAHQMTARQESGQRTFQPAQIEHLFGPIHIDRPYRRLTRNIPNLFSRQLYVSGGDSPMGLFEAVSRETVYIAAVARTLRLTRGVHPDARLTIA